MQTACAHCGREMTLHMDDKLAWRVEQAEASPMVFVPDVDVPKLKAPNIIDDF